MSYIPQPIDTSAVSLSSEMEKLTEKLAENAHDNWAERCFLDGWSYGPERDDKNKKHPDLIPYSQLTDSEKQYDRQTAMETLKAVLALGYEIRLKNE